LIPIELREQQDAAMHRIRPGFARKILALFVGFILILASNSCDSTAAKKDRLIRIIDILTEKNIVQSPFKNIIQQFNSVEENITGQWVFLPDLSSQNQEIWGTSSSYPILGNHESAFPEGMSLLNDGKEVEYLTGKSTQKTGWRWIGTSETLDLRGFKGYDKTKQGIILNQENFFQFEKLVPKGNLVLDLYLVNPNWQKEQLKVTVAFNDSDSEELIVTRKKYFRIRKKLALGRYRIEIMHSGTTQNSHSETPVILGQVKLTGAADTLLLTRSSQNKRKRPEGEFIFQYHTYAGFPGKTPPVKPDIRNLYYIRNKYPLYDSGIEANPYSIKKKILFDEYALNCLAAPPETEFRVDLDIPSQANFVLEFGYGILNEFKNRESTRPILFQLQIEQKNKEQTVFSRTIDWASTKEIIREQIDLSPYAGGNAQLSFLTRDADPENKNEKEPTIVPVWENPLIYQLPEKRHPNVILISLDTVRPDHLGCYGYEKNTSPAIDELAAESVLFRNTYSTTSWTLPGHVSLLTALNCPSHQVYFPLQKMQTSTPTLADFLRGHQFYCAAFTGGGYLSETYGFSKGFDAYQEIRLYGDKAIRWDEAERLAQLATRWLEDNAEKKFFLFLHTYQPHDPYANTSPIGREFLEENAPWQQVTMGELLDKRGGRFAAEFTEAEKRNIIALYDGDLKYTDASFVRPILDKLKELGLYDNSLIILTSDHGEEFLDHEAWLHDHSIYEEGIRIPLIVKFPESDYSGMQIDSIARITDIMPTIFDQAGIKPKGHRFDGASLIPLIEGKEKNPRMFLSDMALREFTMAPTVISVNRDNFKFILNKKISSPYIRRVVRDFNGSQIELYNLRDDPGETKNLAANIAYRDLCFEFLDQIEKIYERAEQWKEEGDEVVLDQSLRERLKALGYIK
jgi:arylsulfatase A-like enzyme